MNAGPEQRPRLARGRRVHIDERTEKTLIGHLRTVFSLTAKEMGEARFSGVLARYIGEPGTPDERCRDFVEDFSAFLEADGASGEAITLARFEMAKRECHGGGPRPLCLADLTGLPIANLATMSVQRHPCARSIAVPDGPPELLTARYPELRGCAGILLCGRNRGVEVQPLTPEELAVLGELQRPRDLFGLVVRVKAIGGTRAFLRLVQMGAVLDRVRRSAKTAWWPQVHSGTNRTKV